MVQGDPLYMPTKGIVSIQIFLIEITKLIAITRTGFVKNNYLSLCIRIANALTAVIIFIIMIAYENFFESCLRASSHLTTTTN